MAGNDAEGKQPTVEEEMAKFTGFSVRDGEVDKGESSDDEKAALLANQSSHEANIAREKGGEKKEAKADKGEKEAKTDKAAELTDEEQAAAIEAAGGDELSDEEKQAAVDAALVEKTKAAEKSKDHKSATSKRISKLTHGQRQAERDRDAAREEAADLRRQLAAKNGDKAAPLTNDSKSERKEIAGKPDPSDAKKYEYGELDAKYIADLTRWTVLDAQDEAKHKDESTRLSKADAEAQEAFEESRAAFEEAGFEKFGDDFQEVLDTMELPKNDPDYWPVSPHLAELVLGSEVGPEMAKELASSPKEARRIHAMSPLRQAAWFGVKEAELLAGSGASDEDNEEGQALKGAKKPLPKLRAAKESKAPLPLANARKLNGGGGNKIPDGATTDFGAFEAQYNGNARK